MLPTGMDMIRYGSFGMCGIVGARILEISPLLPVLLHSRNSF